MVQPPVQTEGKKDMSAGYIGVCGHQVGYYPEDAAQQCADDDCVRSALMADLERARALVSILDNVGENWRDYVPADCSVSGDSVTVGTETLVRCADGAFRRLVSGCE
jgi:hypothetical protein